jgi:hypothetical protein
MPALVKVASQEMWGRLPRGTRPIARCPRGARAREGVRDIGVLVSSKKTKSAGSTAATCARQAARASSLRSAAIRDFF